MTLDQHIQALRDLLRTDHERLIAEVQGWADEAGAAGDLPGQRCHQSHVERLRATPYPWEPSPAA